MEMAISVQFALILAAVLMLASASSTAEPAGSFSSVKTDAESLILFKKMIESDPNGALSGWQLSKDPCTWSGVTCKLGRVAQLDLTQSGLVGQINKVTVSIDPSPPVAIVSDFFLGLTQRLASELGIPWIVFWAGGGLASAMLHSLWENIRDPLVDVKDDKIPAFSFPDLPHSPEFSHREIGEFSVLYEEGDP